MHRTSLKLWLLAALALSAARGAGAADYVWIEAENTASANVKLNVAGWGNKQFLSEDKWAQVNIGENEVEKNLPEGGGLLAYGFKVARGGAHEIWNRIGFEFVRSPFEWRVDGGAWQRVGPEELTSDLMPIDFWAEIAWLKLGTLDLQPGEHKLEIRLPKEKDEKGKWRKAFYTSDAILITPGAFAPNGKYKPDESGRDAQDEAASKNVFQLPEPKAPGERAAVKLNGLWEVCRHDEQMPGEVASPIQDFPQAPHWKAIPVPSNRNQARPDLLFAHRLWYRTRINVPASLAGRAFFIEFPYNNLNTTVAVNGVVCGFNKNPFARFAIDVTKGIKPGANELWVGIKDAWYGRAADPARPLKLRKTFNMPEKFFHDGFQDMAYPVWNCSQSGILNTPTLVAAGPVYATDVFVQPSVANKALVADVTLANTTGAAQSGEMAWQAVNAGTGAVEKTFAPKTFTLAAGATQMVTLRDKWDNPRLWWPDVPNLYNLRLTVKSGGAADISDTEFGFREWRVQGKMFTLNGVVWPLWAELINGATKEEYLANYRRLHQRTMRFVTAGQAGDDAHFWHGLEVQDALRFFDQNGVVVRRNTTLDGETIGYKFSEDDPELRKLHGGSEIKLDLVQNWRDQCAAQARGERNHPSIQIWTIENEFAYINLINLLGNSPKMDEYEREIQKTAEAVLAVDPTRSVMTDGGGAMKLNTLPVHGDHYVFSPADTRYPDLAYEPFPEGGGRGRWRWDEQRPRFIGEDFYATGINPADYAMWGGEETFQGKAQAKPAAGRVYRMLQEGYRWGQHYAAWHFWLDENTASNQYGANPWRAVLVRQWDWTFASGQKVPRTFGLFNDTQYPDPISFTRTLTVGGKPVWTKTTVHTVAPGTALKFDETLDMPIVTARQEGELALTLAVGGKEIYRDVKAVSILGNPLAELARKAFAATTSPPAPLLRKERGVQGAALQLEPNFQASRGVPVRLPSPLEGEGPGVRLSAQINPALAATTLLVYDPAGTVAAFLKSGDVPFTALNSLDNLPETGKVLIVGPDALSESESTSSRLAAYASNGRAVIVLGQKYPLHYQALPAEMETLATAARREGKDAAAVTGTVAFIEDTGHPAFAHLQQKDFFTWGPDGIVYRNPYVKPARGAKSLLQAGPRLAQTVLAEVPVGTGLLLLNQLMVGDKLAANPVAQQLLVNLIRYGASYKLEFRPVAVAAKDDPQLLKALDAVGVKYAMADNALAALAQPGVQLAVVHASPANLKQLSDNLPKVQSFMASGGYIVLHGLTPDGLADYNKLVGFEHMIRPFKRERVTFPPVKSPLLAGVTLGDVVMLSGQRIFGWTADEYVASDVFTYVVDYDEVAPFATSSFGAYGNITNGFVGADGWPLIINFEIPKDEQGNFKPFDVPIALPKPQTITEFTWIGNTNYWPQTKVNLTFEGQDTLSFDTQPNNEPQTFAIAPPRTAKNLTLTIAGWQERAGSKPLVGIDNIYLKAQRPAEFTERVKPMLNLGGLMHYPRGAGGLVLCNLNFLDKESVPVNATKKRTILAALLRNLKAPFAGGKTVIAGANLKYTPIDISKQATQYRNEKGWFGDARFTFNGLPAGLQTLGGVTYNIYDFPTSPVPTVIMLGGNGLPNNPPQEVKGIPVNLKADALFFLHTARLDARRNQDELKQGKQFEMARYVIHYADGQQEIVPVTAEIDIDDFKQKEPQALPGAQLAWTRQYEGTEFAAAAYSKQWNNPRPEVEIKSIDFQYGPDRRGVPVLLAVTAATAG